ncbi:hypothetical protein HK098_002740 [Nowakowskiella sp. JEL0407]|nr:hypothetical protein HK098_002740 [Nowakowskiella sp. JEL0407]
MPKYYCDYCDIFLTHDSPSVRKSHNAGWRHRVQVQNYYASLESWKLQDVINKVSKAYEHAGQGIYFEPVVDGMPYGGSLASLTVPPPGYGPPGFQQPRPPMSMRPPPPGFPPFGARPPPFNPNLPPPMFNPNVPPPMFNPNVPPPNFPMGPKTQSVEALGKLVESGLNVARMNFSHGSHEYHAKTIANLREYLSTSKTSKVVAILLDTKGPEIRTGQLVDHKDVKVVEGQTFTFHNDSSRLGDETQAFTTYTTLHTSVRPGDVILVDDGLIGMRVTEVDLETKEVTCRVENTGFIGENKGVNLPGVTVDLPAITEKDHADILFGVEQGVDFIAASFIRKAQDVIDIRKIIEGSGIKIISKIESQEGIDNFDEILAVSDGIMVARGDLGVEIPVEQVARYQKMMIRKSNAVGKPVVTATQMLESMIVNPRPTRAEATDVANAVLDGSDCVMLSGETAKGSHPYGAVEMMSKICREAELDINYAELYTSIRRNVQLPISVAEAVASSAVKTSWDVHAAMIIVLTQSGNTARNIAKYRPIAPVLAVTASPQVARQCQVLRGIYPLLVDKMTGTDNLIHKAMLMGVKLGMAQRGDHVVVTSGVLEETSGSTNIMRVLKCVGEFESLVY